MNKKEMTTLARQMRKDGENLDNIALAIHKRRAFVKELLGEKTAKKPVKAAKPITLKKPAPAKTAAAKKADKTVKVAAKPVAKKPEQKPVAKKCANKACDCDYRKRLAKADKADVIPAKKGGKSCGGKCSCRAIVFEIVKIPVTKADAAKMAKKPVSKAQPKKPSAKKTAKK